MMLQNCLSEDGIQLNYNSRTGVLTRVTILGGSQVGYDVRDLCLNLSAGWPFYSSQCF